MRSCEVAIIWPNVFFMDRNLVSSESQGQPPNHRLDGHQNSLWINHRRFQLPTSSGAWMEPNLGFQKKTSKKSSKPTIHQILDPHDLLKKTWKSSYFQCDDIVAVEQNTLPETNIAPENRPSQKERTVFQPCIFRTYVPFSEGKFRRQHSIARSNKYS